MTSTQQSVQSGRSTIAEQVQELQYTGNFSYYASELDSTRKKIEAFTLTEDQTKKDAIKYELGATTTDDNVLQQVGETLRERNVFLPTNKCPVDMKPVSYQTDGIVPFPQFVTQDGRTCVPQDQAEPEEDLSSEPVTARDLADAVRYTSFGERMQNLDADD